MSISCVLNKTFAYLSKECFSSFLHLGQDHSRDFFREKCFSFSFVLTCSFGLVASFITVNGQSFISDCTADSSNLLPISRFASEKNNSHKYACDGSNEQRAENVKHDRL
jgi:hypothetical protein